MDGRPVHAWWHPVPEACYVVLHFHGSGGNVSFTQPVLQLWQEHLKAATLVFDYPGYGKSEGEPSEEGSYAAAQAAYDWLITEQHIAPRQILLHGESLGGAVAIDLATHVPHRALIVISTFASIPDMAQERFPIFPGRWLCRTRFDSIAKLRDYRQPLFMAHGTSDTIIPYSQGDRLFQAATASTYKRFCPFEGRDHDIFCDKALFKAIDEFLRAMPGTHEAGLVQKDNP